MATPQHSTKAKKQWFLQNYDLLVAKEKTYDTSGHRALLDHSCGYKCVLCCLHVPYTACFFVGNIRLL